MTPIRTNKPVFFGDNGEVLKSGYIYIGQPNQDGRSYPKTVTFQDSAGSQFTAQQPLRTNDQGQIAYNGKAIISLVDGSFSMLVLDQTQTMVKDGWTPVIEPTSSGGAITENVTQVALTLSDVKAIDVASGDTVTNVGRDIPTDRLGAEWLVISATGSPGDDVDLIDFDNGLQGQRIKNFAYRQDMDAQIADGIFRPSEPTLVWTGSSLSVPMSALSEQGAGWYLIYGIGINALQIYIANASERTYGTIQMINFPGSDSCQFRQVAFDSGNFLIQTTVIDAASGTTSGDSLVGVLNIQKIYKV